MQLTSCLKIYKKLGKLNEDSRLVKIKEHFCFNDNKKVVCIILEFMGICIIDLFKKYSNENIPITSISTTEAAYSSSSVSISWTGNEYATSFSYRLEPLSYLDTIPTYTSWSIWDTLNTANYTNLDDGNYTFYIKSR